MSQIQGRNYPEILKQIIMENQSTEMAFSKIEIQEGPALPEKISEKLIQKEDIDEDYDFQGPDFSNFNEEEDNNPFEDAHHSPKAKPEENFFLQAKAEE